MEKTVKGNTKHSVSNVWLPSFWGKSSFLARPQMQKHFFLLIKNCEAGISATGDPCNKPFPPPSSGSVNNLQFFLHQLAVFKMLERLGDLMSFLCLVYLIKFGKHIGAIFYRIGSLWSCNYIQYFCQRPSFVLVPSNLLISCHRISKFFKNKLSFKYFSFWILFQVKLFDFLTKLIWKSTRNLPENTNKEVTQKTAIPRKIHLKSWIKEMYTKIYFFLFYCPSIFYSNNLFTKKQTRYYTPVTTIIFFL